MKSKSGLANAWQQQTGTHCQFFVGFLGNSKTAKAKRLPKQPFREHQDY
jgi:hypothetical protein